MKLWNMQFELFDNVKYGHVKFISHARVGRIGNYTADQSVLDTHIRAVNRGVSL